ncbi:hypothetical protein J2Y83_005227 [Pseudomonas marginalis]|uniref:hypothetical protein n=1 Tax=Pseudomonas marginalis TaxID=298 RepID=UPI00209D031D|nr:hypothetical protein [Pseudomonas marginalis]MCP1509253.1 hypothetical protein [Pseudomonas marginalis]MCP1526758.1 hypothetical protein [Pseudomonas marginalis]MDQ0501981.1 hypothetical protein [Pseudomonas marginalis]
MNSKLTLGMLAIMALTGSAYAADISICPKVKDITAVRFKDTDPVVATEKVDGAVEGEFANAFKYTASSGGKQWTGEVHGSNDTYLEDKYELKAETVQEVNGKLFCNYGGKTIEVPGTNAKGEPETIKSTANLRLSTPL